MIDKLLGASFRDPSGFMFTRNGVLYRQINECYASDYALLVESGLYAELVRRELLVAHEEVNEGSKNPLVHRVIRPELVPYISYPYEWSFSQLKDAALLTLEIQEISLNYGLSLKDASAYNVQFVGYRPVFIDTLSFEVYSDGSPWVAYRQFCQHFLGPLALMAYVDVRLQHLLRSYIDGLPLDLVSALLPFRTRFRYGLLAHLHLHAASQRRHQDDARKYNSLRIPKMKKTNLLALISSLKNAIASCRLPSFRTEWGNYYEDTNYSREAMSAKEKLVKDLIDKFVGPRVPIHDLGANTGRFSRLVANSEREIISHDIDVLAVERNYLHNKQLKVKNILPLVLDLTNPASALGWALEERMSMPERASDQVVMALALVHHLAISNNVPLDRMAKFFGGLATQLIIEFVPKKDSQVQRLLTTRKDIFPDYTQAKFETAFSGYFDITDRRLVPGTERMMYLMTRKV